MTAADGEPSQFNPNLTDEQLAAIQLSCIREENLIQDRCHKRTYGMDVGSIVGASRGEFTQFIFVEYVNSGFVHGWPITEEELARKRAL